MVQPIRPPATPPLGAPPSQSERTHQAPPRPHEPPPASSARARDGMRNQGNRTSRNLHQAFNSGAAPAHAPAPAEPTPAHPEGIAERMSELENLEKERADLAGKQDGLHSPSAKLKAKELDVRIAMLADHILAEMKMIADISKRANQIATSAV